MNFFRYQTLVPNKKLAYSIITSLVLSLVAASQAQANTEESELADTKVSIEWQNPEKYVDVRAANENRKRFRQKVLDSLEQHFNDMSEKLPADQHLNIQVTDIDLAGRVLPASFIGAGRSGHDLRVIQEMDRPRINLTYELVDSMGVVIENKEVKIKDSFFLNNNIRYAHEFLRYEKQMLDEWFVDTFVKKPS